MKELTIEEKAKHYDEAIEIARQIHDADRASGIELTICEEIFPELCESEDERIRKWLIGYFNQYIIDGMPQVFGNGLNVKDVIAWLEKVGNIIKEWGDLKVRYIQDNLQKMVDLKQKTEQGEQNPAECSRVPLREMVLNVWELGNYWKELTKGVCNTEYGTQLDYIVKHWKEGEHYIKSLKKQGEQKPTDEVEPKFKVGDWVVWDNKIFCHIDNIYQGKESLMYTITDDHNMIRSYSVKGFDNNAHLWTIADAKDGDVLVCNGNIKNSNGIKYERICLFNNLDNAFFTLTKTSNHVEVYDTDVNIDYPDNTVPATKEQKEILFMAMTGAGYTFDFEKKELRKIKQNHAWSEEDIHELNTLSSMVANNTILPKDETINLMNWLKQLCGRYAQQPKKEWSEEDEMFVHGLIRGLAAKRDIHGHTTFSSDCIDITETINWLKSLKDRVQLLLV